MPLTDRKRRYAEARLSGVAKKAAAIQAGCPEKTAQQAASRYEKDPDVMAAMGRIARSEAEKPSAKSHAPKDIPEPYIPGQYDDPIEFMKAVTNDLEADPKLRLDAAKAWASFTKGKPGQGGKKDEVASASKRASQGKFRAAAAPPLKAVK
ncbi:hypothetical protein [uncultured Halomonas sp.]|mgnify:CR=1 FL=1|uniref:hypothetical protein n=1 Tax=uncultured Halomonas sp. TaxID=173971 RepID=UPI002593DF63|nr:hypothetical protein [uncultured Halomonas sp.]|tara:strand:+ start:1043 stop:1495 length:453 start_codon:yes stop_codon:yes gene_type:complete